MIPVSCSFSNTFRPSRKEKHYFKNVSEGLFNISKTTFPPGPVLGRCAGLGLNPGDTGQPGEKELGWVRNIMPGCSDHPSLQACQSLRGELKLGNWDHQIPEDIFSQCNLAFFFFLCDDPKISNTPSNSTLRIRL